MHTHTMPLIGNSRNPAKRKGGSFAILTSKSQGDRPGGNGGFECSSHAGREVKENRVGDEGTG